MGCNRPEIGVMLALRTIGAGNHRYPLLYGHRTELIIGQFSKIVDVFVPKDEVRSNFVVGIGLHGRPLKLKRQSVPCQYDN